MKEMGLAELSFTAYVDACYCGNIETAKLKGSSAGTCPVPN